MSPDKQLCNVCVVNPALQMTNHFQFPDRAFHWNAILASSPQDLQLPIIGEVLGVVPPALVGQRGVMRLPVVALEKDGEEVETEVPVWVRIWILK